MPPSTSDFQLAACHAYLQDAEPALRSSGMIVKARIELCPYATDILRVKLDVRITLAKELDEELVRLDDQLWCRIEDDFSHFEDWEGVTRLHQIASLDDTVPPSLHISAFRAALDAMPVHQAKQLLLSPSRLIRGEQKNLAGITPLHMLIMTFASLVCDDHCHPKELRKLDADAPEGMRAEFDALLEVAAAKRTSIEYAIEMLKRDGFSFDCRACECYIRPCRRGTVDNFSYDTYLEFAVHHSMDPRIVYKLFWATPKFATVEHSVPLSWLADVGLPPPSFTDIHARAVHTLWKPDRLLDSYPIPEVVKEILLVCQSWSVLRLLCLASRMHPMTESAATLSHLPDFAIHLIGEFVMDSIYQHAVQSQEAALQAQNSMA
eukprot:4701173-Prymnesium_polylepis.2